MDLRLLSQQGWGKPVQPVQPWTHATLGAPLRKSDNPGEPDACGLQGLCPPSGGAPGLMLCRELRRDNVTMPTTAMCMSIFTVVSLALLARHGYNSIPIRDGLHGRPCKCSAMDLVLWSAGSKGLKAPCMILRVAAKMATCLLIGALLR